MLRPLPNLPTLAVAVFGMSSTATLLAQTAPDAGSVLRQIERDKTPRPPKANPNGVAAPKPADQLIPAGATVTVKQFRLVGNTQFSDEQLQAVVAPWLNRALDFSELRQVTQALAQAYRAQGWIVRVDLPPQDVTEGLITIKIDEAKLGAVVIDGAPSNRISQERALQIVHARQAPGELLNINAVDTALLLINDLPGVTAIGNLAPGQGERETDVRLTLADEPFLKGAVTLDNRGARSTGSDRLDANLAVNSPLGVGDQGALNATHTQGSDYVRLAYSAPLGYDGWRVGANTSVLAYKLVADFKALDAHGTARSYGVEASYPLVRGTQRNLYLSLAYDRRDFANQVNQSLSTRYGARSATISLSGNGFDSWSGGGFNAANLAIVAGQIDQQGIARPDGSDAGFQKLRYALSRQQTITPELSFYGALSGQITNRNLDSSERFYLGGASGVRAYPTNEGGGAQGSLLNLELRYRLPQALTLTGFYDQGWLIQYRTNDAPTGGSLSGATPNTYDLKGTGITLSLVPRADSLLSLTWARRIGSNPNMTPNGQDQDGSLTRNRVWLAASLSF